MATSERELRERLIRLRLDNLRNQRVETKFVSDQERLEGQLLTENVAETNVPLAAAGKAFSDIATGAKQLGILGVEVLNETPIVPNGSMTIGDMLPFLLDINRDDFRRLANEAKSNQELFDRLIERRPDARSYEFLTKLGTTLVVPEARVPGSAGKAFRVLTAPRRATAVTEAGAGVMAGAFEPAEGPEEMLVRTFGGGIAGAGFHPLATVMSAAGRVLVGGRPAAIQRTDDLLQAEKDLGVTGLLTAAELRQSRSLARIEGILDNLPSPGIGLAGKRDEQQEQFQNAVNRIRAAFPDVGADEALRLVRGRLAQNEREAQELFRAVSESVPDDAGLVEPIAYRAKARELLDRELAKGERADDATVRFLMEQANTVDPVPFSAAQELSSDLARRIRVAERSAQDPASTGIDAGRIKLLSLAHFKDMERWAQQTGGETLELWQRAKDQWKSTVLPFQKRPLAPIFDEEGFDSYSLSAVLLDPVKAGRLAELDETNALGFLLVNDAIDQSTGPNGMVDAKKLVSILGQQRRSKSMERLVPEQSLELLLGLAKLVEAAPRAFAKPTNARVLSTTAGTAGILAAGSMLSSDPTTSAALGLVSLGTIRWLVSSRSGRAILTSAAHTPPTARKALGEMASRARTLTNRLVATAAVEGSSEAREVVIESLENVRANQ